MPRSVNDVPLSTRAARERLAPRHQPYWRGIDAGAAIGYRKGATGGSWVARAADPRAGGGYRQTVLGRADDTLKADGVAVLDFRQAEAQARTWIVKQNRIVAGLEPEPDTAAAKPLTVRDAIALYMADFEARGGKGIRQTQLAIDAHILPMLGDLQVDRITRTRIKSWHNELALKPAGTRAGIAKAERKVTTEARHDPEILRRRRATANRVLTMLKAALNHARKEGRVTCPDDAWALVPPFKNVDQPKIRYLTEDETIRLVNACANDFRDLVVAAILTGCRYGELAALKVADFDPDAGTVTVGISKGGRARHVVLTDEAKAHFERLAAGRSAGSLLLERHETVRQATKEEPAETRRAPWRKSHQFRPMAEACTTAKIEPAVSFHILRHTHASRLAMAGAPMPVIAVQLGHAGTRMTERHYAHLGPSYVAHAIRTAFTKIGIVENDNVAKLRQAKRPG